ncbi:MAG: bifunctional transaldolase/phosoglucose isomerase, partial [Anaerolineae bacterium]|nr:bifunctional transaldolase/phosoglucose isomerase [Anaerolineae bacterium]
MMTKLHDLAALGQSIWYDNISREILNNGEFAALLQQGILGVTSNPTILEKAISGSDAYDDAIREQVAAGSDVMEIYESLAIADISRAADMLRSVFDATNGGDGFVSLEVDPRLAHDTTRTISEARRLFGELGRPNVMIKVPATPAGIPAIETLIGEGININVTLIFSQQRYEEVAEAYLKGLEALAAAGGSLSRVASVASFFVSRVDSLVDKLLAEKGNTDLQGKIAVANSKLVYERFQRIFSGPRWEKLAAQGARVQRPLWASTSTKNPSYPDTLYVDTLIGPHTVNTVPPDTLAAILDHADVRVSIVDGVEAARQQFYQLAELGIDMDAVTDQLQDEGVDKFAISFNQLLERVEGKRAALEGKAEACLGELQAQVDAALAALSADRIVARLWAHDHTIWRPDPTEISNRLGWLYLPETMREHLVALDEFVAAVRADGYSRVLLLGMGGSSLAPEVFSLVFGAQTDGLALSILDSTDPGAVLAAAAAHDPAQTLFIVATKSGGTAETLSAFKFFYSRAVAALGKDAAGQRFIAITDPGSKLVTLAEQYAFRHVFLNDPNLGGRYSALSLFGLVPAALVGVDVARLLDRAAAMAKRCQLLDAAANPGAWLGAILGGLAQAGRDKLTFVASPQVEPVVDWIEQLIAESTGKDGEGILPVVREPLAAPGLYGADRLFVSLSFGDDAPQADALAALEEAGYPVMRLGLADRYDLGGQFMLWEVATAVAGHILGIQP